MKPLVDDPIARDKIIRRKRTFGILYGAAAGIAFAVASWGMDGYRLSVSHAYHPWVMLLVSLVICAILGGISGWLTARFQSGLLGIVFWLIAAAGFAWLVAALPLRINPSIVSWLDPQLGALLQYSQDPVSFNYRIGTALIWMIPFTLIVAVVQLPISEPAVFSISIFGKAAPMLFSMLLLGLGGTFTDSLINVYFRDAILALDTTIQFVVDNQGNENVDPALSRQLHTRALWEVNEYVQQSRELFVSSFDEYLGEFHVLVKFGDQWVDCTVLYNQPNSCRLIPEE